MTIETAPPSALIIERAAPLSGRMRVDGDRLVSHLALAAAALTVGETVIEGLAGGADIEATREVVAAFGAGIRAGEGFCAVHGLGLRGLLAPRQAVALGPDELTAAIGLALAAILPIRVDWTARGALATRDVADLLGPLRAFGVTVETAVGGGFPLVTQGPRLPAPIAHRPENEAAALLSVLAALAVPGATTITLPAARGEAIAGPSRAFGADIAISGDDDGMHTLVVRGLTPLRGQRLVIAGDPEQAAWAALCALIVPKSDITIENVLVSPSRTGLIDALLEMGGNIDFTNQREEAGEHVADLRVRSSYLRGVTLAADRAAAHAGLAVIAVAGAYGQGQTRLPATPGLRLLASAMQEAGVQCTFEGETMVIEGRRSIAGGVELTARNGRSALALAVLAMAADKPLTLVWPINGAPEWPSIFDDFARLGARFEPKDDRKAS